MADFYIQTALHSKFIVAFAFSVHSLSQHKNVESATSTLRESKNRGICTFYILNETKLNQLPDAIDVYIVCNLDFYKRHMYNFSLYFIYIIL